MSHMARIPSAGRPLSIVHCVRAPVGGVLRHILDLAAEQSARGHHVGMVVDKTTCGAFEAKRIESAKQHFALGVTKLPMARCLTPADLFAAFGVYRTVRSLAPDVLHGHGAKGGAFARVVGTALSRPGRPVLRIYTPHGGSLHHSRETLAGRIYFGLERKLELLCDGIIHVSRFEADAYLAKIGKPRCSSSVILNGLRNEEFDEIVPREDARDLVFLGTLRDLKGPDVLLRALALLKESGVPVPSLAMVGDGPDREACRSLAEALGLSDAVDFHPSMPARDGLAMGQVMIVPSRAESLPYVVLEAVAAGRPLIASRVGGIPEILGPSAPELVPAGDAEALAKAISAALAEPSTAKRRALGQRRALRDRFTVGAMADQVEQLYGVARYRREGRVPIPAMVQKVQVPAE
jgi:glycosyltransferase involved in cell wall biosynthesis